LNNAVLHAGADSIRVRIAIAKRSVKISVEDDGHGLPAESTERKGVGIETMRYRAAALQAQLLLQTAATGGTVVTCECPQPSDFPAAARRADKSLS
jgi:signal transduction histidine kinase